MQRKTTMLPNLYRVRRGGRRFDDIADFWYPTEPGLNRCNIPGQPVLYASPHAITALDEMQAAVGDVFVLIQYRGVRRVGLDRLALFLDPNPEQGARILEGEDLEAYSLLRDFVRAEFTKPVPRGEEHLYRISAAICRTWTDIERNDGWIYPSVKSETRENVAIKAESADEALVLEAAQLVEVADDPTILERCCGEHSGMVLNILATADFEANEPTWRDETRARRLLCRIDQPDLQPV